VGYNLFQRRERADAPATEFAATVLSMPPPAGDSLPAAVDTLPPGPDSLPAAADSGIPDVVTDFGSESLPAPADATVEQQPTLSHIGRYALKGLLGQGGLGQVHEAWDPLLSRTVAVKTLQFDLDTPARISLDGLFLNEARAAAGLSHPHIVTVFDAGLSAHGVYIAMERLHGCDLGQKLAGGWRPRPMQAAQLVRRVADALAYAHARGVVHCDIKPANIFLNRRDKPKVLDFGIARVTHGHALPALDDLVAGSPHYLAPEQLQGGTVDARTDIHALGVVFYELLTGRKAYVGETLEQITGAVLNSQPVPAHELQPAVSPTLSAIAAKAMARDPAERHAGAAEMAAELRRWVQRHSAADPARRSPGGVAGAAAAAPARAPAQRRPIPMLLGGAVLVGTLLALAALAWLPETPPPGDRPAAAAAATPGPAATQAAESVGPAATVADEATTVTAATAGADAAAAVDATAAVSAVSAVSSAQAAESAGPAAPLDAAAAPPAAAAVAKGTAADARPTRSAPPARTTGRAAPARPRAAAAVKPKPAAGTSAAAAAPVATGALQLAISPWGEVEIDGTPAGTAPPLTRLTLPEGQHTVTVRNADFPPYTTSVQVSADQPAVVRHRFAP
jgi:serine/threonine-protein kinase